MSLPIESWIVFIHFECQRQDKSSHPYVHDSKQCGPKRKPQNWIDIHRIRYNKPKTGGKNLPYVFASVLSISTDFLRHAPCMRHVKKDYEVCAIHYQSTMAKIGQSVATTTTTTVASSIYPTMATHPAAVMSNGGGQYHSGDMSQHQHHHHRQQQQHEHLGRSHPNSTKLVEDAEEERLKTVCW